MHLKAALQLIETAQKDGSWQFCSERIIHIRADDMYVGVQKTSFEHLVHATSTP